MDLLIPDKFKSVDINKPQWLILESLCAVSPIPGLSVSRNGSCDRVSVIESVDNTLTFWYTRDIVGKGRSSVLDLFGLVGLGSLNVLNHTVFLTEGVSDFITMKLCFPSHNVLGFTSLGGSIKATKIILSLFDTIIVCSDNDMRSGRNTGVLNAIRLRKFYQSYNKDVVVVLPKYGCKDMTEQFLEDLRVQRAFC